MVNLPRRHLPFQACFNFRDLGGYVGLDGRPVRWQRLFRSMTPEYMTPADAATARGLNIGLVIDFRGERFTTSGPVGEPPALRLALGPGSQQLSPAEAERLRQAPPEENLPRVLERHGPYFAQALVALAEKSDASAVFHCRLGKDRTGVFAALVLKLAGVSDDEVMQDYLLTDVHEPQIRELLRRVDPDSFQRESRVARESASRVAMEGVLQRLVSQYGGAYGYFAQYGVSASTLQTFVASMLEEPFTPDTQAAIHPGSSSGTVA